jgi:hypothetical protein
MTGFKPLVGIGPGGFSGVAIFATAPNVKLKIFVSAEQEL